MSDDSKPGLQTPPEPLITKPPRRAWKAEEPFIDFKASHWVEIFLTAALLLVGATQAYIYSQQASIMQQQMKSAENLSQLFSVLLLRSLVSTHQFASATYRANKINKQNIGGSFPMLETVAIPQLKI
jgi:hypothetical protein